MDNFKTIEIINKFISIITSKNPTSDDKFFACNIELFLVPSIIQDFGEETSKRLGKILVAETE